MTEELIPPTAVLPPAPPPGRDPFTGKLDLRTGEFVVEGAPDQTFLIVPTMARYNQVFMGFMLVKVADSYRYYRVVGMDAGEGGVPRLLLDAETRMDPIRLSQGLNRILQNEGRVCEGYGTCTCRGCSSSYAAFCIADAYLRGDEASLWPDDQVRPRTMNPEMLALPRPFYPCTQGDLAMTTAERPEPPAYQPPTPGDPNPQHRPEAPAYQPTPAGDPNPNQRPEAPAYVPPPSEPPAPRG